MQSQDGKVKVCFVVTKGVWGGAQKYVYSLSTNLSKDKYEAVVICGQGQILKEKLEEKDIKVYELHSLKRDISILAEIKSFFNLLSILRKEKPSVLHLNSPKASGLGALAGRLARIPKIIFTAHGWTFNEERGPFSTVVIKFLSWVTIVLSHKIITIAEREKRQAQEMPFVRDKKIELIRNGIEKIEFKERDFARMELLSKTKMSVEEDALWIGTISELHKNKGLEYSISAMAYIKEPFVFFIIGEGEKRSELENLIKQNKLENKVFLVGFVDKANEYLKAFDIFTLTSIKEGLPYTILEAGQAGLPVMASNVGGIPDIIDNGINGILVTKSKPGEITRALQYLIDKPEEAKLFGEKLKEKVEKEFSVDQMLEKTLRLYV